MPRAPRNLDPALLYRTLFTVLLQKTVRVPDRAEVIAHGQESFYLFCSVTRVTKVSELFFSPLKQVPLKIFKIVHVGTLVITHHNITYTIMLLIKSGGKISLSFGHASHVTRVTSRESRFGFHQCHYTIVTKSAIDNCSKSNNFKSLFCRTELEQWFLLLVCLQWFA